MGWPRAPRCSNARRSTPARATSWPGSAGNFRGCAVEKQYTLQTADGPRTLAELFDGRSQLLIYHFMFGPSYEAGCPVNSSIADSVRRPDSAPEGARRDADRVSAGPIEKLLAYRERMGWRFTWASSYESDFNVDIGFSSSRSRPAQAIEPMLDELPPIAERNATEVGTDIVGYLTELFRLHRVRPGRRGCLPDVLDRRVAGSSS